MRANYIFTERVCQPSLKVGGGGGPLIGSGLFINTAFLN